MSLVYVALRKSGKWTVAKRAQATIPPFEALDGPYDHRAANFIVAERNRTWGRRKPRKNDEPKVSWLV